MKFKVGDPVLFKLGGYGCDRGVIASKHSGGRFSVIIRGIMICSFYEIELELDLQYYRNLKLEELGI